MTDENENPQDDLKTFDIYHCFSRWDVLLAVACIVAILAAIAWYAFFKGQAV